MTLEQIQKLTDDELRVRVAELRGWKNHARGSYHDWRDADGCSRNTSTGMPNYPADLNACHEFERNLAGFNPQTAKSQYGDYISALQTITGWWRTPCAPARARCEAFLTVMGKDTP